MNSTVERETMDYDVVIVGGGPAGLAAAIRLKQIAAEKSTELSVCLLEKGSEIGAHILSGAIIETRALDELLPDWKNLGAPLDAPVTRDAVYFLRSEKKASRVPSLFVPKPMHNTGNQVVSLGRFCRWLGEQAEALEVDVFAGFAAADVAFDADGRVSGVLTGDMGVGVDGQPKDGFAAGMQLNAKYTIFAEGSRGHLGRRLIERFSLDEGRAPQHYGIGLKELWSVEPERHEQGLVVHAAGWPLIGHGASGGAFMYHLENNQVAVGLVVDLNYANPWLNPFLEFQQMKHHPVFAKHLEGGERTGYGARAITKGGLNALPKMAFPGGLLVGCDAGTLNFAKIKGTHTAMKTGILAAESIAAELIASGEGGRELVAYTEAFEASWAYADLKRSKRFGAVLHRYGPMIGGAINYIDQNLLGGRLPLNPKDATADHASLKPAAEMPQIEYPKPDGKLSFDRLSSVYISNTNHEEDQPVHLTLKDQSVAVDTNLAIYESPEQRYCPAGVYEIVGREEGQPRLQISASNCVHCKTCDIKDPTQNIVWVTPEGGGGPNYTNM